MRKKQRKPIREIRLMLSFPSRDEVSVCFMSSVLDLLKELLIKRVPESYGYNIRYVHYENHRSSILPLVRQKMVDSALEQGCTHILMFDSDMNFPPELAHYWLGLSEAYPVIAANCTIRATPGNSTARLAAPDGNFVPVYTTKALSEKKALQVVDRVGTGVMLIDLSVFSQITKPYFPIEWNEEKQLIVGEDWGFCRKLQEAGIPIVIDHFMSYQVEHAGTYRYNHRDLEAQNLLAEMRKKAKEEQSHGG